MIGFVETISIYATIVGVVIPPGVALLRWMQERSRAGRRRKYLDKAITLRTFVNSQRRTRRSAEQTEDNDLILSSAKLELDRVLVELSPPSRTMSPLRRSLLLFRPSSVRAWVAHILFFIVIAFSALSTVGFFAEQDQSIDLYSLIEVMPTLICLALIFRAWALFESRIVGCKKLPAKRVWLITFYPANSALGLLAHIMFIVGVGHLILLIFPPQDIIDLRFSHWYLFTYYMVGASCLPIAYYWSQVEYFATPGRISWLRWRDLQRLYLAPRFPEQTVALCFLSLFALWVLWGVAELIIVPLRPNLMPDFDAPILMKRLAALCGTVVILFTSHILPFFAVFRGTSVLFNEDCDQSAKTNVAKQPSGVGENGWS